MRHWRPLVDIQPVASHEVAGLSLKSERVRQPRILGTLRITDFGGGAGEGGAWLRDGRELHCGVAMGGVTWTPARGASGNSVLADGGRARPVWRRQPKWVVSHSLKSVGPNATLVEDDLEAVIGGLKARLDGEIEVAGPGLAGSLTNLGLIDEYRLYFRPVVLGRGKPFFAGPRPPLRFVATDPVGEDAIRLTYIPA